MARMDDGFSTLITFGTGPSGGVKFWEKEVTPIGYSAGGAIDTTTMHNTAWRTRSPKKLKTATEASAVVAYDPDFYNDILSIVGLNQQITIHFPDGDTLSFYGWLDEFKPNRIVEGEQPTAEIMIIASNQSALGGTESAPNFAG